MIAAFRSEFLLLNRSRMWVVTGLVTVVFTVATTVVLIITARPAAQSVGDQIPLERFSGPGGATAAVTWSFAFGFLLLLAAVTSKIGNEFTRGTFRTALLHHPNRWSLIGGKMAALVVVTVVLIVVGLVTGAITAAIVAPGQNIDTAGWFSAEALGDTLIDFPRMVVWAFGWAMIGTTLAVLVRSVPIAVGAGVLWFGPIENGIGEGRAFAERWFPGQLLRAIVEPNSPDAVSTGIAVATLAAYGLALVTTVAIFTRRRDVTS